MVAPANYARSVVMAAVNSTTAAAVNYAGEVAGFAGLSPANIARQYAQTTSNNALSLAETTAINLAITGASGAFQAAGASGIIADAQMAAALVRRADVLAGVIPQILSDAQGSAAVAAQDVADTLARDAQNAITGASIIPLGLPYGRSTPCNQNSISEGGQAPIISTQLDLPKIFNTGPFGSVPQNVKVDRSNRQFIFEIDGKNLIYNYQNYIESVSVVESCDHTISSIKIVVTNEQQRFGDDEIWDRGKKINYWFGFQGTGIQKRGNTFISQGPRTVYSDGKGTPKIVILGYGEEMRLGMSEERKTWTNVRDSEIAQQIASKYGWSADVERTDPVHDHVAQVNESDWKFLDRIARYYGFQVYLDGTTLHFHSPRFESSGLKFVYRAGQNSQLNGFTVWETPLQHGKIVQADQIDPLAKQIFTVSSAEQQDAVTKGTIASYDDATVSSDKISAMGMTQPRMYMLEEGHKQTVPSLGKETEGMAQSTRWLVQGEGDVVAAETMRVRSCIELMGIGRDSGEYYIKELKTSFRGDGLATSKFKVARTWRGAAKGSRLGPLVFEPQSVPE